MSLLFVVVSFIAAFLLSSALNWLALISWRRSTCAHWTERARRLYPVRVSAMFNPWLFAANAAASLQLIRGEAVLLWLPSALAAWLGTAMSGYLTDRQIWPKLSFKSWSGQFVLYAMFFQAGLLLVGAAFVAMPPHFGWQTWVIAGVLLVLLLSLILGFTLKILQWTHLVQPAPDRLRDIASRAAERAGAKLGEVWVNQGPLANAFALLPMNDMLFSQRLLEVMPDEELESICAHEAAHLTESKWVFCGRLLGALALCPLILILPVLHRFGLPGLLMVFATTMALVFLPRWLARRMEKRADSSAASQTTDPAVYARALEKLYETNLMPAAMPKRNRLPHPDLYDRMIAAGVIPPYERPRPPGNVSWTTSVLTIAFFIQVAIITSRRESLKSPAPDLSSQGPMSLMIIEPQNPADAPVTNSRLQ